MIYASNYFDRQQFCSF